MGWRCSDTAELSYADVRVPAANLVGAENSGFAADRGERSSPSGSAWPCRRTRARSAASTSPCEWCRDRETFGRPLISPAVGAEHAGRDGAAHRRRPRLHPHVVAASARPTARPNLITEVCFAKNTAVEAGEWVADQAVQLFGGMGYMRECRGRAAVPRHAHPRHRRRHHRDPHRAGREDAGVPVMSVAGGRTLRHSAHRRTTESAARRCRRKLAELDAEHAKALAGGGAKYVDRHHDRGKLTRPRAHRAAARPRLAVPGAVARSPRGAPTSRSAPASSPASAWSRASSA